MIDPDWAKAPARREEIDVGIKGSFNRIVLPPTPPPTASDPVAQQVNTGLPKANSGEGREPGQEGPRKEGKEARNGAGSSKLPVQGKPTKKEDEVVSLDKIRDLGRYRLCEVNCKWSARPGCSSTPGSSSSAGPSSKSQQGSVAGRCDAMMASYKLFQRHMQKHYDQAVEEAESRFDPDWDAYLRIRCAWQGCKSQSFHSVDQLERHVLAHMTKVKEAVCPFKTCLEPQMLPGQFYSPDHYVRYGHTQPYSRDDLRPHPQFLRVNAAPMPPPPIPEDMTAVIQPYLVEVMPYRKPPATSQVKSLPMSRRVSSDHGAGPSRKRRYGGAIGAHSKGPVSRPLSLEELAKRGIPIVPNREGEYFSSTRGDAVTGRRQAWATSSSIFRHPFYHADGHEPLDTDVILDRNNSIKLSKLLEAGFKCTVEIEPGTGLVITDTNNDQEEEEEKERQARIAQGITSPFENIMPPGPSKPSDRPVMVRSCEGSIALPKMCTDAADIMEERAELVESRLAAKRKRVDEEGDRKGKGKAKEICPDDDEQGQFGEVESGCLSAGDINRTSITESEEERAEKIRRASVRHARKVAHRSYGARYREELLMFQRRGKELGEIT